MNEYQIVPMKEAHVCALAQIDAMCFSDPWTQQGFEAELTSTTACFFVAEQGETVVGCAGMHCICGECYIDKVCVPPQNRRKGIAQALVGKLVDYAQRQHAEFLTLEVRASNVPAIALYSKFGFAPVGVRKSFYTNPNEDAVLMTKYI